MRARPLIGAVSLTGLALLAFAVATIHVDPWPILLLGGAAVLAEAFPVPIAGVSAGATSFASVFLIAAAVLRGWQTGVILAAATMLIVENWRQMPIVQRFYNTSLYVIGAAAAGAAASLIGRHFHEPVGVIPALAFYLVDLALLTAVVWLVKGGSLLATARGFFGSAVVPVVMMTTKTALLILVWRTAGAAWILLLLPALAVMVFYQRRMVAALERQKELDELKDEFIAVVSHEIRTPLTTIVGSIQTIARLELPADVRQQLIEAAVRESARLTNVLDDVLVVSRLERKTATRTLSNIDVRELVEPICQTARSLLEDSPVTISASLDPVRLRTDGFGLTRVLANLIDNAVKYSPDGGPVDIVAARANGGVHFEVRDRGIGVPPEEREHIFDKFTRLDPGMKRGVRGTGLGLYICRELVRQLGGEIHVEGRDGGGSVFAFDLPQDLEGSRL